MDTTNHAMKTHQELKDFYRSQLLDNVVPFWLRHGRDMTAGGYHTCLARDGSVYDYDKVCMWHAGRLIWVFSHLYNELEAHPEWLEFARHGIAFVDAHGFAADGSMYFSLTREGKPLQPACDLYTELSTILGYTEFARASEDDAYYQRARELMLRVWGIIEQGGEASFPPLMWETRPVRRFGHSMIVLNVLQQLQLFRREKIWDDLSAVCVQRMLEQFFDPGAGVVYEYLDWDGGRLPGTLGRRINPGHMIEGGIFLIHESRLRGRPELVQSGVEMIRHGYNRGWDTEFGGIFNDVDMDGLPIPDGQAFVADSKLWWQHAEALYGMLLAWQVTGEPFFRDGYWKVHDYSFSYFADPEYGEWFAHLDRRGNPIGTAKGTIKKNLFHIGRNFFWCHRLLQQWPEVKPD